MAAILAESRFLAPAAPGGYPSPAMSESRPRIEAAPQFPDPASVEKAGLSALARGLVGSEILKIAGEIRALQASGRAICNLTVGDFASSEFRIPPGLEKGVAEALSAGLTNYPPSDGIPELRREVLRHFEREHGLVYPVESVLIASGARPVIYATYKAVLDPGEKVLYSLPSWNNNHYAFLAAAKAVELPVGPEDGFLPTAARIAPLLDGVRLICINTPLNPAGTVMTEAQVRDIATLVVDENRRRLAAGARPVYLMWDQVYAMLTFGGARHYAPPELVPAAAAWTIFVDGISKSLAATGLRVGWAVAPPYVTSRMRDFLGHVGAWAPKPEQAATAKFLADREGMAAFHAKMIAAVRERLDLLHGGFADMAKDGIPVSSLAPQGAIYLSARFDLVGRTVKGTVIRTNEQIRRLLLEEAGFAVVPFQAFGLREENGWMRLSVGAVSPADIKAGLARVRAALAPTAQPARV